MKSALCKCVLWLCVLMLPQALWAAAPLATVTIADGEAVLIRGAARLLLAEGVRLAKDDIVETPAQGRLVRIEFSDGLIVDLGPQSRALLAPKLSGDRARFAARLHLLHGTAKLTVPQPLPASTATVSSPAFDVKSVARSAVFVVQADDAFAFAESGELVLQERRGGKPAGAVQLKGSEFFARSGGAKASVTARPTAAFIKQLPRAFLDTLPARAGLFKTREAEPRLLGDIRFPDVQAWVDAEGLRSQFVTRWRALAQNPAFRAGLAANMRNHPEWDRVLYPEKYLPKPAASAAPAYGARP